jgi:hypothetical protein
MDGAELAHQAGPDGNDCGFETIVRRYELIDPTLWRIAEIVHEATFDDEHYYAPEARGLDALVLGQSLVGNDDHTLAITKPLFDGHSTVAEGQLPTSVMVSWGERGC